MVTPDNLSDIVRFYWGFFFRNAPPLNGMPWRIWATTTLSFPLSVCVHHITFVVVYLFCCRLYRNDTQNLIERYQCRNIKASISIIGHRSCTHNFATVRLKKPHNYASMTSIPKLIYPLLMSIESDIAFISCVNHLPFLVWPIAKTIFTWHKLEFIVFLFNCTTVIQ